MTTGNPGDDDLMGRIGAAVEAGHSGDAAGARGALTRLWEESSPDRDAFHRCVIAHYLADLQETVEDELAWDERALAAVTGVTDERVREVHDSLQVKAFLPSLHLNLADGRRRLGDFEAAAGHLAAAREHLALLGADAYGDLIRSAVERQEQALAVRSTAPSVGSPSARDGG